MKAGGVILKEGLQEMVARELMDCMMRGHKWEARGKVAVK